MYNHSKKGKHCQKGKHAHQYSSRHTDSDIKDVKEHPSDVVEVTTMSRATGVVSQLENAEMDENEHRDDEESKSNVCALSINLNN